MSNKPTLIEVPAFEAGAEDGREWRARAEAAEAERDRLRALLEATVNLERQSHRLWDQAWLVLIGNPSDAAREEAEQATLQATRLHRQAIDLSGVDI